MERRLTLRETQPALGGSEKPPVVDGKIEKVTFSQSVFFLLPLSPKFCISQVASGWGDN